MSPRPLHELLELMSQPYRLLHDRDVTVGGIRSIYEAGPGELSFAKGKHNAAAADSAATVIVTDAGEDELGSFPNFEDVVWVLTEQPRLAVAEMAVAFEAAREIGVHATAVVHATAELGEGVYIGPNATVGARTRIGDHSWIGAGVHIYRDVRVGARCTFHAGVIIGGDGFGFERHGDDWVKVPHLGLVIIGDDVEIGANSCVDRGTFGDTVLEDGVKLDNLVHVAHNVRVGTGTVLTANTMVAGSTTIGPGVWSGPSTSFMNGITVGAGAFTGLGAVVIKDVEPGQVVAGVPAKPIPKKS